MGSGYSCGVTLGMKGSHQKAFVTGPNPVCLMLRKVQIQNASVLE